MSDTKHIPGGTVPAFLSGGGEMAARIASFDWSASPLGALERWPEGFRGVVGMMLRSAVPMLVLWGAEGVMIYNDAFAGFAGTRHPACLGREVGAVLPEMAEFNDRAIDVVLAGQTMAFRDVRLTMDPSGHPEETWLNLDYSPLLDDSGAPVAVLTILKDTTARMHVEQRLRIAQEAGGVGTFEWYPETGHLAVSDEYRRIWGLSLDVEVTDRLLVGLLHPDDRSIAGPAKLAQPNPLEYAEYRRFYPETGESRWIARRGEAVSSPDSAVRRFVGVAYDITARKSAETALQDSEARFRSLAQSMPNHVWTARPDGELDWFNDRVYAYGGYADGELGGNRWTAMVHPDDLAPAIAAWTRARAEGRTYETEFRLRRHDGVYRWHIARAVPIRDSTGAVEHWIGTNTDIEGQKAAEAALADFAATLEQRVEARTSELLRTQEELRQSQKMESIGNLTGGIAHDFNNLLQVISGNLQLLAKEIAGNPRAEQRMQSAMAGVARGSKLANQLLAFGRRQPLAPKSVNVEKFIRNMDELLRRALGEAIEIETIIGSDLWNTLVDPANIENAVLNLAINARDAMEGHGRLTIEASNAVLDDDYAKTHAEVSAGSYVMLAVSDTGSGIPPDILAQVFDPFFTTKPEGRGTGLGLSMVYGFVKQSGGHVKIYSEVGHGTTVRLYLPRAAQEEDFVAVADVGPIPGGTETVLVAEDDAEVRATVVETLVDLGYAVIEAKNAEGALAILESGAAIDLLFTDVVMPGTLKSPELARRARERLPDLAVLFTSGYTENSIVHGGRLDPGVELLSKPYSREALARKVRHVLGDPRQRDLPTPPSEETLQPMRTVEMSSQTFKGPEPAGVKRTILLVEDDDLIRFIAADLLQELGHEVVEAGSGEAALDQMKRTSIDVIITDLGLPGLSGEAFANLARAAQPDIAIVFATGNDLAPPLAGPGKSSLVQKPYDGAALARALAAVLPG